MGEHRKLLVLFQRQA